MHKYSGDYPKISGYSSFVVTFEPMARSRFYTWDFWHINSYVLFYVYKTQEDKELTLLQKKYFKEMNVEVRIYGKK